MNDNNYFITYNIIGHGCVSYITRLIYEPTSGTNGSEPEGLRRVSRCPKGIEVPEGHRGARRASRCQKGIEGPEGQPREARRASKERARRALPGTIFRE